MIFSFPCPLIFLTKHKIKKSILNQSHQQTCYLVHKQPSIIVRGTKHSTQLKKLNESILLWNPVHKIQKAVQALYHPYQLYILQSLTSSKQDSCNQIKQLLPKWFLYLLSLNLVQLVEPYWMQNHMKQIISYWSRIPKEMLL